MLVNSNQTQKKINGAPNTMFPAKTINLLMFLCGLNEKKKLDAQNSQNWIIWYPINITK